VLTKAKKVVLDNNPDLTKLYIGLWIFLVIRMHLLLYLSKGFSGFVHLSKRFPNVWINTMLFFPIFFSLKLVSFILFEMLPFEHAGEIYRVKEHDGPSGDDGKYTLERYKAFAMDLNKPLLYRTVNNWLQPMIYPFLVSSGTNCNIYSIGPYTGFGVLNSISCQTHVILRNSLFGTHPASNYYICFFVEDDGNGYVHTVHACAPGLDQIYKSAWSFYADHLVDLCVESEGRINGAFDARIESLKYVKSTWKPVDAGQSRLQRDSLIAFPATTIEKRDYRKNE